MAEFGTVHAEDKVLVPASELDGCCNRLFGYPNTDPRAAHEFVVGVVTAVRKKSTRHSTRGKTHLSRVVHFIAECSQMWHGHDHTTRESQVTTSSDLASIESVEDYLDS